MRSILYFVLLLTVSFNSVAQSANDDVKAPIMQFFNGMRGSDSAMIRGSLAPSAILQSVGANKDGKAVVETEDLNDFITVVTKPHKGIYDERVTFDLIKTDGDLAMVWAPYQFYVSDTFSHCGVDCFQLVRLNGQWKIQYIIDTRRKDNCPH